MAIACDLGAFCAGERAEHERLRARLQTAVTELRELPDGLEFRIAGERLEPDQLMRWVLLERLCCPFLGFEIELGPERGPTWLRLRGGPGVKEFLQAEMGR